LATPVIQFEDVEIDLSRFEVRRGGLRVHLEKQPFDLLALLLQKRGDLVGRKEIAESLWDSNVFVETDRSINNAIRKIRLALADDPEHPRFIETVPGRGYRFIASVSFSCDGQPESIPPQIVSPDGNRDVQNSAGGSARGMEFDLKRIGVSEPGPVSPVVTPQKRWHIAAGLTLIGALLLAIAFVLVKSKDRLPVIAKTQIHSLAVLPLDNLSDNTEQDYFADGMTDELITELAQLGKLRVISRTSVLRYKKTHLSLPEIARELNVDAVVEGSVLRSGDRVRISAQLLDARADRHMWAHSYEGELRDVLTVQREVAHEIAQQIRFSVSGEQKHDAPVRPLVPEAHDAYLQGRYHANKQTQKEIETALQYYRAALAKDPDFAPAYAAMAECYDYLALYYWKPRDALPQAKAAALKAVELDDSLADGHAVLGIVYLEFDFDWPAAEREMQRALELNPSSDAHLFYAEYLASLGRREETLVEIERARSVDPFSLRVMSEGVFWEFIARKYDLAIQAGRAALASEPNDAPLYSYLGLVYATQRRYAEAVELAQTARRMDESPFIAAMVAYTYAAAGRRADAERMLSGISEETKEQYSCSYEVGAAYTALGEVSQAFHWLDKAYEERSTCMVALKQDPRFDGLHSDLRFQALVRRVGFPEN
jgi:TolB-like protein/DNA-binding winged helix-turn-helix (wHTH) protein/tetratricopeptide (TPR) repeat protein